ncbi:MAG: hypothetical protein HOV79_13770 [Hamadaea sp.]|nr:hypothetical protein [Hamadaea sp.]
MNRDDYLADLGISADDPDAVALLIEAATENGDLDLLRQLADAGSKDATDQLVELAEELGDLDELRRLAAGGNRDAADILVELGELPESEH